MRICTQNRDNFKSLDGMRHVILTPNTLFYCFSIIANSLLWLNMKYQNYNTLSCGMNQIEHGAVDASRGFFLIAILPFSDGSNIVTPKVFDDGMCLAGK